MLSALERILGKLGEHDELGQVLARQAELASEPERAGRLPVGAGRRCGSDRSTTPRGRSPRSETPSSATPRTPPRTPRWCRCSIARRRRRGRSTSSNRWPRRAGDYQELVALYGRRVELRDDRNERAHWLRRDRRRGRRSARQPDLALEALGRALKEEPAPGAALDDLERIAGAAKLPAAGAAKIEEALAGAEPDAAEELALRAARLYQEAGDRQAAPSASICASSITRRRERRCAFGARRSVPDAARRRPSWPPCSSDGRRASSIRRSGGRGCSRRRGFTKGRGISPRRWRRLQQLRAADDEDRRRPQGAGTSS